MIPDPKFLYYFESGEPVALGEYIRNIRRRSDDGDSAVSSKTYPSVTTHLRANMVNTPWYHAHEMYDEHLASRRTRERV